MNPATLARFEAKVEKTPTCWLWTAATTDGYGQLGANGKVRYAHRLAYEHFVGPIPEGMQLDHLCRTRRCVNPEHLEAVTGGENFLRGNAPAAINARRTTCSRNHAFTPENTGRRPCGRRYCRTCKRKRERDRRAMQNAA